MRAGVLVAAAMVCIGGGEAGAAIDFTNFHTPAQVQTELGNLAATHPTIAQLVTIGTSVEGRPITALKMSDNVNVDESSEGDVVFVGLHHAREWIAAELALSVAEHVVTHYASDAALQACVNNLEIWIIPVTNPDGYAYSAASSANRYWRKNRRNNGDGTFGVDLNRNYSYQWGFGSGSEGSDVTLEDTYRGPIPFSEPETAALRDFVKGLHNPQAFVSYHSFSELFLRPWSYTTADPPGEPTLGFIAQNSISRIAAVHGHTYSETIWYNSYGEATDYFWSDMRLAGFTPELRPATGGLNGFSPPPTEIVPTIEENLPAALALISDAGCRTLWIKDYPADTGTEPSATWLGDHWSQAFWISPDIWTVPEILTEGSTVALNVRVHNAGSTAVPAGTVRAYYTDPRVALEFPSPTAVLIGEQTVTLPPGDTTLTFSWTVPTGTNIWGERHWCVGAIVSTANDRPLTTQIERSSNIAARNFQTVAISTAQVLMVAVTNFLDVAAEYRVTVDPKSLPRGWEVAIPPVPPKRHLNQKARLLGVRGNVLEPGETILQPVRVRPPELAGGAEVDLHVNAALLPLVPGKRVAAGNGYTFRLRGPANAR